MIDEGTRALFLKDLEGLINRHCLENDSNTPDWILARHMMAALEAFGSTSRAREEWYGRSLSIGGGSADAPSGSADR